MAKLGILAEFEAFRNNLLVYLGRDTITLRELYRGARGQDSTLDRYVKLSDLEVINNFHPLTIVTNDKRMGSLLERHRKT